MVMHAVPVIMSIYKHSKKLYVILATTLGQKGNFKIGWKLKPHRELLQQKHRQP